MNTALVRITTIFTLVLALNGCMTYSLNDKVASNEMGTTSYKADKITAVSAGRDEKGREGWVFIGNNYDYFLNSGIDNIMAIYSFGKFIDKNKFFVKDGSEFIVDDKKTKFFGNVTIEYRSDIPVSEGENKELLSAGFKKNLEYADGLVYSQQLNSLNGVIHAKNNHYQDKDLITLKHPFDIEFYQKSGVSGYRALYPVTIAADAVTLPLQIIGGAVYVGAFIVSMGSASYH